MVLLLSINSYAQKSGNSYPWNPFRIGDITLRVSHDFWVAKDSKNHELSRCPVPKYVTVATPLEKYTLNGRHFIIWNGWYPHCSTCEFGALIFDFELQKFYRYHAVPNDDQDGIVIDSKIIQKDNKRYVQFIGNPPQEILQKFLLPRDIQVTGELCSADYCDDPVFGPQISQRAKDEEARENQAANQILNPLGLSIEQKYPNARKILIDNGWKPFIDDRLGIYESKNFFEIETFGASGDGHRATWKNGNQKLTIDLCADEKRVYSICGAEIK